MKIETEEWLNTLMPQGCLLNVNVNMSSDVLIDDGTQ